MRGNYIHADTANTSMGARRGGALTWGRAAAAHYALAGALRASGNVSGAIAEMTSGLRLGDPYNDKTDADLLAMHVRLGQLWQHSGDSNNPIACTLNPKARAAFR